MTIIYTVVRKCIDMKAKFVLIWNRTFLEEHEKNSYFWDININNSVGKQKFLTIFMKFKITFQKFWLFYQKFHIINDKFHIKCIKLLAVFIKFHKHSYDHFSLFFLPVISKSFLLHWQCDDNIYQDYIRKTHLRHFELH